MQNCFAYKQNGCTALKIKKCEGCSFYKTKEQYKLDQQKVVERILLLDEEKRIYIIQSYYGGKMGGVVI
jgi:hypothetical protein